MSFTEESPAQRAARLRRERREAKIREGGAARLDKITSLSGRTPQSGTDNYALLSHQPTLLIHPAIASSRRIVLRLVTLTLTFPPASCPRLRRRNRGTPSDTTSIRPTNYQR